VDVFSTAWLAIPVNNKDCSAKTERFIPFSLVMAVGVSSHGIRRKYLYKKALFHGELPKIIENYNELYSDIDLNQRCIIPTLMDGEIPHAAGEIGGAACQPR
jgi:hypothetical protein